ncbi:MAG TPA: shikimate kinase [Burkholderiales bacterium]|jgi:shikimate kinase|nr:shikimate kinase [Burkholderiales bacterium]
MHEATLENQTQARVDVPGSIFLVGMMGAGKTSVGRVLAKRLQKTFYDSDHVIEDRTGVKIPVIFEIEGEAGFRVRESVVLDELTALRDVVLATGGGAVLSEKNRDKLRTRGTVVYLRASVRDLLNRTRHDKNRPLLQAVDPRARLTELYEKRDPLYRAVAHLTVDTGNQSLTSLVNRLCQLLLETRSEQQPRAPQV